VLCDCDGGGIASADAPRTITDAKKTFMIFIITLLWRLFLPILNIRDSKYCSQLIRVVLHCRLAPPAGLGRVAMRNID
jgi:hypothetical protein